MRVSDLIARYGLDAAASRRLDALAARLDEDEHAPSAVRGREEVLERHIADSLVGLEVPRVRDARLAADLGSGAGLPGIVLGVSLPHASFALVESRRDRCAFLASVLAEIDLPNVRVACARAEQWEAGLGRHDLVVARALAAQSVVLEYAAPLLAHAGSLVEWRGGRDAVEEREAERAAAILGLERIEVRRVEPFPGARERHLHVFEKVAPTPARFPRRPGLAARKPLGG